LEPFDDSLFGREMRLIGKPGREEDRERSSKNESRRNERLFPGLFRRLIHVGLISLMVAALARLSF
jgi:hypothetical protein